MFVYIVIRHYEDLTINIDGVFLNKESAEACFLKSLQDINMFNKPLTKDEIHDALFRGEYIIDDCQVCIFEKMFITNFSFCFCPKYISIHN